MRYWGPREYPLEALINVWRCIGLSTREYRTFVPPRFPSTRLSGRLFESTLQLRRCRTFCYYLPKYNYDRLIPHWVVHTTSATHKSRHHHVSVFILMWLYRLTSRYRSKFTSAEAEKFSSNFLRVSSADCRFLAFGQITRSCFVNWRSLLLPSSPHIILLWQFDMCFSNWRSLWYVQRPSNLAIHIPTILEWIGLRRVLSVNQVTGESQDILNDSYL